MGHNETPIGRLVLVAMTQIGWWNLNQSKDNVHVSTGQREKTGTRRSTSPQAQHPALSKSTTYPALNLVLVPAAASPRRLPAAQARRNVAHVGGGYTVRLMAVRFRPQTQGAREKRCAGRVYPQDTCCVCPCTTMWGEGRLWVGRCETGGERARRATQGEKHRQLRSASRGEDSTWKLNTVCVDSAHARLH